MPGNSPIYGLPYLVGSDGGKRITEVSEALALKLDAVLAQNGNPPLDSDLTSLLQRLGTLEDVVSGLTGPAPFGTASLAGAFNAETGPKTLPLTVNRGMRGGFTLASSGLRIPKGGRYRAVAAGYIWATAGSYRSVQIYKGGARVGNHTQNSPWTVGPVFAEFDAVAGDIITARTDGDGAVTFQPFSVDDTQNLYVTYLGPSS